MVVIVEGRVTEVKLEQPSNTLAPTLVMLVGILIDDRLEHE